MIQFSPECNLIKLVQNCLVEAFADTISLRMSRFGLGVFYAVYTQIKLVVVRFQLATVFRSPIRQDADNAHFL